MKAEFDTIQDGEETLFADLIMEMAASQGLEKLCTCTPEDLRRALTQDKAACAELIRVEGEVAGYVTWFYSFSTFLGKRGLYIEDIFIRPAYRRKGVGRAVLAHMAEVARAEGCARVDWEVQEDNAPAVALYESTGAQARRSYYTFRLSGDSLERA